MSIIVPDAVDEFMDDIVIPTVKDYLGELDNIRRGKLAAIAFASLGDYFVHFRPNLCGTAVQSAKRREKVNTHLDEWSQQCRSFGLVRDIADATKHVRLNRATASLRDVAGVQKNLMIYMKDGKMIRASAEGEPLKVYATYSIIALLPDGTQHPLLELFEKAVPFVQTQMGRSPVWPLP